MLWNLMFLKLQAIQHAYMHCVWHVDADCEPMGIEQVPAQVHMVDHPKMLALSIPSIAYWSCSKMVSLWLFL